MALYEYKGQQYDIATDDPVIAKNKILKYLETGEGESKPKSAQPAPVEGEGGAVFGVYRPAGRRPENQNRNREENKDMALQTGRGVVSNVFMPLGMPVDIANAAYNLPRTAQDISNRFQSVRSQLAGNEQQPLPELPPRETIPGIGEYGMNFYNQFVPGPDPENAAGQLAFAGGQALGAPIGAKAVSGAIAAPRAIRSGVNQVRTGAMEGVTNPVQRAGPNTAFAELSDQVYPNTTVKPYMKLTPEQQVQGLPALEASRQPSNSLFSGFLDKAALRLAPEGPAGGKLVPLEGRGLQAMAEQTTRDIFNKPTISNLGGLGGNIGGAIAGGLVGNLPGAVAGFFSPQYIRALNLLGQRRLQNKAALQPDFQQQLGQAQQTAGRLGIQGNMPQTPLLGYNPSQGGGGAAGPVRPTMYVDPAGTATTNLAGTQVNMNPGSLAAPTAAANAAMATTQRVATGQPTTPRAPRAPAQPFVLPDAGTHYAQAAQGSDNFGDTFNKAVAARKADLLKDSQKRGQKMTAQQAEDTAFDEIKAWRSQNVPEFAPTPKAPELVGPVKPADVAMAETKQAQEIQNAANKQRIEKTTWQALQQRIANGGKPMFNEQKFIDDTIKQYGEDPFGTGKIDAGNPSAPVETPAPTKQRDMSVGNAKKQFYKDIENDATDIDAAMKKYEIVTTKKQMRVYDEAYDAAIAEGKDVESARRAGKQALQRNGLPPLFGDRSSARLKPKDTNKQETAMGQAWFDDTIKNADKQTKQMYQDMLENTYNGDVGQLYRDMSAQQAGKTTGKSFFEEPLNTAMPETTPKIIGKNEIPEPSNNPMLAQIADKRLGPPKPTEKTLQSWDEYEAGNKTSPETGKYMSPEEMMWRDMMKADEISSTTEMRQVGVEGKGKKAKPIIDEIKITSYDPDSWFDNIQPDIDWTSMVKEHKIGREPYPTFTLKGTKDGVDYTLKLNKNSAHMGDLYADINGKPTLVKQWYNDYSERAFKNWDKVQAKHKLDLYKEEDPFWEPRHTDARGYKGTYEGEDLYTSKPKDVMEMMTGGKVFDSKKDYEAQVLLDRLAGKPTTGSFVDNGLRYEITEIDYGNTPKDLLKRLNKPLTEIRVFSERTNNQISGPAPDVPEKPLRQRIEERRKGK